MTTGATARVHPWQPRTDGGSNFEYRFAAARPWLEGKTVLDIGAARGYANLHRRIREVSTRCVAADLNASAVTEMQARGMEAVVADATALDLEEQFDVVFAGELIEHLDNFRGFFDSVRRTLGPDGVLVLTTPNAFRYTGFIYRLGDRVAPVNDDHMVWFDETTLRQLVLRMGYEVVTLSYITHDTPGTLRSAASKFIRRLLPPRLAEATLFAVVRPCPSDW